MVGMLFLHFQRASITKYISFHQNRLPREQATAIVKEIATVGNINQDTLSNWKDRMFEHNSMVERGERMMLMQCKVMNLSWIKFRCLDLFMIQIQSRYLAKLLDDFSSFGERVLLLIHESPASLLWTLGGQMVVERTSWFRLCAQVMTLLHVFGVADPTSARLRLRPWPDRELLEAAAGRARGVFGRFARAYIAMPTVRSHLVPTNARDGSAAAAADQRKLKTKRRRESLELPPRAGAGADASDGPGTCDPAVYPAKSDAEGPRRRTRRAARGARARAEGH